MNKEIEKILDEMDLIVNHNKVPIYFTQNDVKLLLDCITNLKEYEQIGIMQFNRPYAKRYLKECKEENPKLLYPDSEDIYKKYYNLKEKNKRLEQEIEELREAVDRLTNKEYKKDDSHLGIVRTKEQLERMQSLLCFKSKVEITDILIDIEEKINKAIKYIKNNQCAIYEPTGIMKKMYGKILSEGNCDDLLDILQGSDKNE